ncbi:MAG: Helix-turn-helix domain [Acidobacteriota bacterium]|jgi:transcriptional regulator with XRE-family HTH domain|nr:Helix-turn-helix domain [Acidobacteriota bacterium]
MARGPRERPERLAEKLRTIRQALGLSQTEILRRLGADERMAYHRISEFESGKGEPSLIILLQYARVAGVSTDVLIDDWLDLPAKLPAKPKSEGVMERKGGGSRERKG